MCARRAALEEHISKQDVWEDEYGMSPGCKGCIAANRGVTGVLHNERRRETVEGEMRVREPERCEANLRRVLNSITRKEKGDKRKRETRRDTHTGSFR